jgi:hypothetical protein
MTQLQGTHEKTSHKSYGSYILQDVVFSSFFLIFLFLPLYWGTPKKKKTIHIVARDGIGCTSFCNPIPSSHSPQKKHYKRSKDYRARIHFIRNQKTPASK